MKKVVVTGGAGYIGSVAVKKLVEAGYSVVVIDNLSKGIKDLVNSNAVFYHEDVIHKEKVLEIFESEKPNAVMHFASYKAAGESMKDAEKYSDNIVGLISILDAMKNTGCKKLIYSSSAAVYGDPEYTPIDEKHPTEPINYYGFTKRVGEELIEWYQKIYGLQFVSLRYFNVIGDGGLKYLDPDPQNVLPIVMEAITKKRDKLTIFGEDYETRDGTCIRDYIDVNDLVDAHIKAIDLDGCHTINLGTGEGVSVKEFVQTAKDVSGKDFSAVVGDRREGDPETLTASNEKAKDVLGWSPQKKFSESLEDAYHAYTDS